MLFFLFFFLLNSEDMSKVLGSCGQHEGGSILLSAEKVKDAAKAGLSAAAMKAKLFADHEEREIQRLCANIVNNKVQLLPLFLFLNLIASPKLAIYLIASFFRSGCICMYVCMYIYALVKHFSCQIGK